MGILEFMSDNPILTGFIVVFIYGTIVEVADKFKK